MKKTKTLSQMCEDLGVPRQTLQGWVDKILDNKDCVTGQGFTRHFNEEEIKELRMIKEMKDYNSLCKSKKEQYTNSEIKKTVYGKPDDFKAFHEKYLLMLKKRREEYDRYIEAEEAIAETGITPEIIHNLDDLFDEWNYDKTIKYLSLIGRNLRLRKSIDDEYYNDLFDRTFSDEEMDILLEAFDSIPKLYEEKYSYDSEEVQLKIAEIYKIISKIISESLILFECAAMYLTADDESTISYDETVFFINAVKFYCANVENSDNETDKAFTESFEKLYKFCMNKNSPSSAEAQGEIEKLCSVLFKIEIVQNIEPIILLENFKEYFLLRSDEYVLSKKRKVKVYIFRYIANAFQFYCEHYKRED